MTGASTEGLVVAGHLDPEQHDIRPPGTPTWLPVERLDRYPGGRVIVHAGGRQFDTLSNTAWPARLRGGVVSVGTAPEVDDRFLAAVDLVRRTGASDFQIRYQDELEPTVWIAVAGHYVLHGQPVTVDTPGREQAWTTSSSLDPGRAVVALAATLLDGGSCVHCDRPSALEPYDLGTQLLDELVCWTQYDPELKTYRRGCEGSDR